MARTTLFFLVAIIFLSASLSSGHPPFSLEMEFDLAESLLTVSANHPVIDNSKHYVDRVVVRLNGNEIIKQKFMSQLDSRLQVVEYRIIDAKSGDEIEVTAGCNISSQAKASIVVAEPIEEEPEAPAVEK